MPLPSKPYQEWTHADLKALTDKEDPAKETARVDFKAECKLLSKDKEERHKARRDILVDISAMANGVGGALLLGVRQSGKPGDPPKAARIEGIEGDKIERLKQAIEGLVATHLQVRPASLRYHPVPTDNKRQVLIVEVEENSYSLSMVTYDGLNQFWVRRGTDNRLMTTDEIQYAFDRMTKVRHSAEEELERIRSELHGNKDLWPLSWFIAVPIARSQDHIPVNTEAIAGLLWARRESRPYFDPRSFPVYCPEHYIIPPGSLRPSLHGMALDEKDAGGMARLQIRRDGTVVFGVGGRMYDTDSQDRFMVDCAYGSWYSGLCLLKDTQEVFPVSRVAIVQAGVSGAAGRAVHVPNQFFAHPRPSTVGDHYLPMTPIMLPDNWEPQTIFDPWALQFANAVGQEQAFPIPPFVKPEQPPSP